MTFEELEIKLGKKLNREEWKQFKGTVGDFGWIQNTVSYNMNKVNIWGNSIVYENCYLDWDIYLFNNSKVYGNSILENTIFLHDNNQVYDFAELYNNVQLFDNSKVYGNSKILHRVAIYDNVEIFGYSKINGPIRIGGNIKIFGNVEINPKILEKLGCNKINNYYDLKGDFEIYDYKSLKAAIMVSNIKIGL